MYHPYFRGKQYELITIRENAELLSAANFVPIIEPVKEALSGLQRTLDSVVAAEGNAIVVVNPQHGDHSDDADRIVDYLNNGPLTNVGITPAILLKEGYSVADARQLIDGFSDHSTTLIHAGFSDGAGLANALGASSNDFAHVFIENCCGRLYRRHFNAAQRILVRDGFEKRRNKDHPVLERFSDLHITFAEEGMSGFGDFLTVGDGYSEAGGPAYAIAIHLTFIDPEQDDEMFLHHFLSIRQDTPADPAGKFAEALHEMIRVLDDGSPIFESNAVGEFRALHQAGHYPGLGYVKKLSMQHHLETLANYFEV
jgi:hypothetical protein